MESICLFLIFENGKAGYIDRTGKIIIEPQFDAAFDFHEGLARICKKGPTSGQHRWGFIDEKGMKVIELQAKAVDDFYEGMALYQEADRFGYIDTKGQPVIKPIFHSAAKISITKGFETPPEEMRFSEGLAAAQRSIFPNTVGYINTRGEYVVKPQFRNCYRFSEGLAAVNTHEINKKWGSINKDGEYVIEPQFKNAPVFSEGLAYIGNGYVDKAGKKVIEFEYMGGEFHEGLARFQISIGRFIKTPRMGFIDRTGKIVIEPQFGGASDFHEGFACAKIGKKFGYIDNAGKTVIEPQFDIAEAFHNGLARIGGSSWFGYIDKTGFVVYRTPEES
jgi:WG containing repeat